MKSSFSRVLSLTMGAALAVGAVLATVPANAAPADGNLVPDANLRACINDTMQIQGAPAPTTADSITQADLDALAAATTGRYSLTCTGVASLEGLQYLTDPELFSVEITDGQVGDVTPLVGLTTVYRFYLSGNKISDLTPLAGLTSQVDLLDLSDNQISDLTPLAGLTNLRYLYLSDNQISDLAPLSGLTNLQSLDLQDNQIRDLTRLSGLTLLNTLVLSHNQISDVSPLTGLTGMYSLFLSDNQISDIAPLARFTRLYIADLSINEISDVAPLAGLSSDPYLQTLFLHNNKISDISPIAALLNANDRRSDALPSVQWTLSGNQITDVSSLDWNIVGTQWLAVPSEYVQGVYVDSVAGQTTAPQTAVAGATVPLPQVVQAANDPNALIWTVTSGDATIDQDAGTVTYNSVGPVLLSWADSLTVSCANDRPWSPTCESGDTSPVNLSFFSGSVSVNVSEAGAAPVPSVPESEVAKDQIVASTTGGAARIADGTDTYTLVTTVRDENGVALNGYVSHLSASSASQVSLSAFTPNGDGTYSLVVSSTTPGNYAVTVSLDGTPIQNIPVNFIGATVEDPTRLVGQQQVASALGFLPGEQIHATLHSDPIDLGSGTANNNGIASVTFTIPTDFALGRHTVEFVGATSGTITVAFDVVELKAETGGSTVMSSGTTAAALTFALCTATAFALVMGSRRRIH